MVSGALYVSMRASQTLAPTLMQACLEYVRELPGVQFDTRFIAAAGVSNGGFMAVPIASRYSVYTHAMIFHARSRPSRVSPPFVLSHHTQHRR